MSAFFARALLSINHSFHKFHLFRRLEIYPEQLSMAQHHWVHLVLVHAGPFFLFMLYFCTVTICINICPLLMFWSWWIPLVRPCRFSTLHWGKRDCSILDHSAVRYRADIQIGTRDKDCILQPPMPGIHWFHADEHHPVLQWTNQPVPPERRQRGDPETGGLLTETVPRSYEERKRETGTRLSHFG